MKKMFQNGDCPHFRLIAVTLCLLGFLGASPVMARESVSSIIRDLQKKVAQVKSMQADLEISASFTKPGNKTESFKASGKLYTEVPDHLRLDLVADVHDPDRDAPVKFITHVVLDGETLSLEVRNSYGKTSFLSTFDFTKLKEEFPEVFSTRGVEGYYNPIDELSELDLTHAVFLGRTSLGGHQMVVLESMLKGEIPLSFLNLPGQAGRQPGKVRVWIGSDDGLIYQTLMLNRAGKKAGSLQLSNVHLNAPIDAAFFRLAPSPGTTPVDMTPTLEEELRQRKSPEKKP